LQAAALAGQAATSARFGRFAGSSRAVAVDDTVVS
jgi:hypothetical protein